MLSFMFFKIHLKILFNFFYFIFFNFIKKNIFFSFFFFLKYLSIFLLSYFFNLFFFFFLLIFLILISLFFYVKSFWFYKSIYEENRTYHAIALILAIYSMFYIIIINILVYSSFFFVPFIVYHELFFFNRFITNFILDNISLVFIFLTFTITPLIIITKTQDILSFFYNINYKLIENIHDVFLIRYFFDGNAVYRILSEYSTNLIIFIFLISCFSFFLFCFFTVLDILYFYVFFEASMIPLFLLIIIFGPRKNKIKAAYYIFFYTLISSIPFFFGILYLYSSTGSTNLIILYNYKLTFFNQKLLFFFFFIPFAVKIPVWPLHIWLPEAHVEASTEGSVLLAGLLLKVGGYGIIKIILPLFPKASLFFTPFIHTLAILGIIHLSISIFKQIDIKKIIAYSSIIHMNFALIGLFSHSIYGIQGALYLMYTHGIVSSGLFLCFGFLYKRFRSRLIYYYHGSSIYFPQLSFFFLFFCLANFSFPFTGGFIAELLILIGIFKTNQFVFFMSFFSLISSTIFSMLLFIRVVFLKSNKNILYEDWIKKNENFENKYEFDVKKYSKLFGRIINPIYKFEFIILFFICIHIVISGLMSFIIIDNLQFII